MNKVILVGHLAIDPEVRYTQTGKAVASFRLAVNKRFSHNQQNTADFFNIIAWQKLAEICGNNLTKGRQILVEGFLQTRTYNADDGSKRYITEVVAQNIEFMGKKTENTVDKSKTQVNDENSADSFGSELPPDEEIPF
ncbi:single-stranded DNA-binding protein [Pectinatus frisingensis]|uniref:single-stranded DNA-binding protein n=1 Tax=Pectinatus frisingensis TaxID=865 RepID=UPI0018C65335|nr:single-stranded DNA-binding protein [Pectinatus frisingensis]